MAELINEIISPEAFKQVADMKSELASLTKQMEDMLKAMGKAPAVGGGNAVKNTVWCRGSFDLQLALRRDYFG